MKECLFGVSCWDIFMWFYNLILETFKNKIPMCLGWGQYWILYPGRRGWRSFVHTIVNKSSNKDPLVMQKLPPLPRIWKDHYHCLVWCFSNSRFWFMSELQSHFNGLWIPSLQFSLRGFENLHWPISLCPFQVWAACSSWKVIQEWGPSTERTERLFSAQ